MRADLDDEIRLFSTLLLVLVLELDEILELHLRKIQALSHCCGGRIRDVTAPLPI